MQYFAAALKHHARTSAPPDTHEHYLRENPDYGEGVLRVQTIELLPCWYGYIYTRNLSPHMLCETLRPQLEGLSVMYPHVEYSKDKPLDIELQVPSNEEHIVILRRSQADCSFSLGYLTRERRLTNAQMLQMAVDMDERERTFFGDSADAFFKLCRCE